MSWSCADICDSEGDSVQYADCMPFIQYSKVKKFSGRIRTVKCFEDNSKVKEVLASPGERDVLVVDALPGIDAREVVRPELLGPGADPGALGVVQAAGVDDHGVDLVPFDDKAAEQVAGVEAAGESKEDAHGRSRERRGYPGRRALPAITR